tara:strand:- start:3464 stop:3655 length:192 start_codon:yes stop_codon:yes gene_type:complete
MKDRIKILLRESTKKDEMQYQIRYIDGPVFYKRVKGDDYWSFITSEEFVNNVCDGELIKWDKK